MEICQLAVANVFFNTNPYKFRFVIYLHYTLLMAD